MNTIEEVFEGLKKLIEAEEARSQNGGRFFRRSVLEKWLKEVEGWDLGASEDWYFLGITINQGRGYIANDHMRQVLEKSRDVHRRNRMFVYKGPIQRRVPPPLPSGESTDAESAVMWFAEQAKRDLQAHIKASGFEICTLTDAEYADLNDRRQKSSRKKHCEAAYHAACSHPSWKAAKSSIDDKVEFGYMTEEYGAYLKQLVRQNCWPKKSKKPKKKQDRKKAKLKVSKKKTKKKRKKRNV